MIDQAYNQKNSDDHDANTLALNNALLKIESNKKIKATVAQLSQMTGIHRNTISNRVWPVQKLNEIKSARKAESKSCGKQERQNINDTKISFEEKLTQAQMEVIYWFNEYQDMKRFFEHSNQNLNRMKESQLYYKSLYEADQKSLLDAEHEIERLKKLLELTSTISNQLRH